MPGKISKYSPMQNGMIKMKVLDALVTSKEMMTIDDIKLSDFELSEITSQKISRTLGELVEQGFVRKARSKALGRMVYKSTAAMKDEGYDVE